VNPQMIAAVTVCKLELNISFARKVMVVRCCFWLSKYL